MPDPEAAAAEPNEDPQPPSLDVFLRQLALRATSGDPQVRELLARAGLSPVLAGELRSLASPTDHAEALAPPASQEEKLGSTTPLLRATADESYEAVLRQVWETAAGAALGPTSGAAGLQATDNPVLGRVRRLFPPTTFYSDEAQKLGSEAAVSGLIGSLQEIALQVSLTTRRLGGDRPGLRQFFRTVLAATIERLEREEIGNPERRTDLVLVPLNEFQTRKGFPGSLGFRRFIASLRGYLEQQPPDDWTSDYFATRGALGDMMGGTQELACLFGAIFYYHEILAFYVRMAALAPDRFGVRERRRVLTVANNTSGYLDDIRRLISAPEGPRVLEVRHDLMQIAAVMTAANLEDPDPDLATAADLLARYLAREEGVPTSWVRILDTMMRGASAWSVGRTFLQLSFLEAAAGVLRAALRDRRSDAAPSFFNAGVSIQRHTDEAGRSLAKARWGRAVMSTVGLWWSQQAAGGDVARALISGAGLSCAVNLFGALADSGPLPDGLREHLRALAAGVFAAGREVGAAGEVDFFRMTNSLRQMEIRIDETPVSPGTTLDQEAQAVLAALLELESRPALSLNGPDPVGASLAAAAETFEVLVGSKDQVGRELAEPFTATLAEIAEYGRDPAAHLIRLYERFLASDWPERDPATTGSVDRPALGPGPAVIAGLTEVGDWEAVGTEAVRWDVPSLGAYLRQPGTLDWFVE